MDDYVTAESQNESYGFRKSRMRNARLAYDEWVSGFHNHRECPKKREEDDQYAALKAEGWLNEPVALPEKKRLGQSSMLVDPPDESEVKH